MNQKDYLTNKNFCPMPWTGLMYNFDGNIKNCIRSAGTIGNIQDNTIEEITNGSKNNNTKFQMANNVPGSHCSPCYNLEEEKNKFDIISDRIFYLRELKQVPMETYQHTDTFDLHTVDVRWTNLCNFSCVYCGPEFSSKWAKELRTTIKVPEDYKKEKFKEYIFDHAAQLKHVYLAGGEPLLMKENLELLQRLLVENPKVNLRINTNLSKVDTPIFDLICKFKNVHWIVSIETTDEEYEYIRHGGSWHDFIDNLNIIQKFNHKISFNMLYFLLNYKSLFKCIDFLKGLGFHNNSFIVGALIAPEYFDVRHLPEAVLTEIKNELQIRINEMPGFLLENGYKNLLSWVNSSKNKNLSLAFQMIKQLDQRRGLDSRTIFKDLYYYE
jgi:sulfatase maturation enzyme AslB (radical SAM superfamily)